MKDMMEPAQRRDDIDRIVDALLENPDSAGDIKALLRNKMTSPDVVRVAWAATTPAPEDEVEDFWDNVPV